MHAVPIGLAISGVIVAAYGVWGFTDRRAERVLMRPYPTSNLLSGRGGPIWAVLNGTALVLVGLTLNFHKNALTLALISLGVVIGVVGFVFAYWHPRWVQPAWMRDR